MCISPCRLMNIYLHKACTKLLQLTVIGWTITVKDGWGGSLFFFFSSFLKQYFFYCFYFRLAYVLWWHADKLEQAGFVLFFPPLCSGDGLFKMYHPVSWLMCRLGVNVSNFNPNHSPGLEDLMIPPPRLAANYLEGFRAGVWGGDWGGGAGGHTGALNTEWACYEQPRLFCLFLVFLGLAVYYWTKL